MLPGSICPSQGRGRGELGVGPEESRSTHFYRRGPVSTGHRSSESVAAQGCLGHLLMSKLEEGGWKEKLPLALDPSVAPSQSHLTFWLVETWMRSLCRVRKAIAADYRGIELGRCLGYPWQRRVRTVHIVHTKPLRVACGPFEVVHHTPHCVSSKVHFILHSCSNTGLP